jgi:hypothetical protein
MNPELNEAYDYWPSFRFEKDRERFHAPVFFFPIKHAD